MKTKIELLIIKYKKIRDDAQRQSQLFEGVDNTMKVNFGAQYHMALDIIKDLEKSITKME